MGQQDWEAWRTFLNFVHNFGNPEKGALKKGYLHKIVRMRQICDNFAHPSSEIQNEIQVILRKFGAQFATNLRNAPFANAPFFKLLTILAKTSRSELPAKAQN